MTPLLTRRSFVKTGGALFVSLSTPLGADPLGKASAASVDASCVASWLEIRSDNSILARTGRTEIGTGMSAFYVQMIAEELRVPPEAITLLMGDTDKTPDGGYSAGFLNGAANVRKVAAYTYQALLGLASKKLGVPASALRANEGIVSGGGASVSYGELVEGEQLDLRIPVKGRLPKFVEDGTNSVAGVDWEGLNGLEVTGDPPMKPVSEFKYIGESHPMPGTPGKITGEAQWSCDVRLPGMLHARMIRPATLGSTLVSVGELDPKRFPTAEIVRKSNLLAVVSPDEWVAVKASQSVAAGTKWTEWSGLPGSENLAKTLREYEWGAPDQSRGDAAGVTAALGNAAKTISATYEQPYIKHAPIGPYLAVADVRSDGSVMVWSQAGHLQASRTRIAHLLDMPMEKVVVRWLPHAAQFGRKTFGGDGAEADAVILSKLTGKPVRVQWTLQEDLAWSAASPGWVSDAKCGLDAAGRLVGVQSAFYSTAMFDARPLGAILAGMPAGTVRSGGGFLATEWAYDKIPHRFESASAMPGLASQSPNGGIRGLIMRTPGQRQQNFVLECLINEAAASAGADPIQFRIEHTSDERLITILRASAKASGWDARPSPHRAARRTGNDPVTGRGVAIMVRTNGYWVAIAEILVTPDTGVIRVTDFTIGVECGKIINPRQLDRCMKGGVVMGLSEALKEEVTFDNAKVTSTDWSRYKILTMEETPEIKVVQISRDDKGFGAGGEAPNALPPAATAAAFFDATGVMPRRIPLSPAYVKKLLQS